MDICGTAREANALFLGLILALVEEYHNIVAQVANLRQPLCLKYTSASGVISLGFEPEMLKSDLVINS
jgi:hypothetical protein